MCRQGGGLLPCNFFKLLFLFSPATFFSLHFPLLSPVSNSRFELPSVGTRYIQTSSDIGLPRFETSTRRSQSIVFLTFRDVADICDLSLGRREKEKEQVGQSQARTSFSWTLTIDYTAALHSALRSLDPEVGNPGHGPTVSLESTTSGSIGTDAAFNRRQAGFHCFDSVSGSSPYSSAIPNLNLIYTAHRFGAASGPSRYDGGTHDATTTTTTTARGGIPIFANADHS